MKTQKMPRNAQLLICIGLLLVTVPTLFREYTPVSDFFRGFLVGIGLVMEVAGLVVTRRWKSRMAA